MGFEVLLSNVLGFFSLSSVKAKSKLSSHGQGGAGKTTLAAMLVRNELVRRAFTRIGWVSVGQTPDIAEMQRILYAQLTGGDMEAKPGVSLEKQLQTLKESCAGKRCLLVLDDVWDISHEKLLNCIDDSTTSKLVVTTRIRGLLKGCDEMSLELLSKEESIDLLLRTGGVDDDDAARSAAAKVADLCGHLPLFLGYCGGVISDYDGDCRWQTRLVELLLHAGITPYERMHSFFG